MSEESKSEAAHTAPGELTLRAFGPVADALGLELAKLPPFAVDNLQRLVEFFLRKNSRRNGEPKLSPRLIRQIVDEAAWSDEAIIAEYLSGVAASSGDAASNDRGVAIVAAVRRLSAMQLKAHYLFYNELRRAAKSQVPVDLRWTSVRSRYHVEFALEDFLEALESVHLSDSERRDLLTHIVLGLAREGLIDEDSWDFVVVTGDDVRYRDSARPEPKAPHVAFHPSPLGAELFLWGCGSPITDQAQFFDAGLELIPSPVIRPLTTTTLGDVDEEAQMRASELHTLMHQQDVPGLRAGAVTLIADLDTSSGYFYLAIANALENDFTKARDAMAQSAARASADEVAAGLSTMDELMISHPSIFDELLTLAKILELRRNPPQNPRFDT